MSFTHPILDTTNWSHLIHAYGWADDVPDRVRALLADDADEREAGFDYLFSAVIHQGTPWSCTAPVALVVADLLAHPKLAALDAACGTASDTAGFPGGLRAEDGSRPPPGASLLSFLGLVAEVLPNCGTPLAELEALAAVPVPDDLRNAVDASADPDEAFGALFEDEETCSAIFTRAVLDCVRIRPVLLAKSLPCLGSPVPVVRACAAETIATLARQIATPAELAAIAERLREAASAATMAAERASHVLALGSLTPDAPEATAAFLSDSDPAVRLCAALAPAHSTNPAVTRLLHDALADHAAELETWFSPRPVQIRPHARFAVLAALLERTQTIEQILPAALALIPRAQLHTVDGEWGQLLRRAFPPEAAGQPLTPAQHAVLGALVANEALWDPHFGNPLAWFKSTGLEYDREACQRLLARDA